MKPLTYTQMENFCHNLAVMLHAGLPLSDGLFLLAQEETGDQAALLTRLGEQLDSGESLSGAMEQSGAFGTDVTGMVRVGERTGRLEQSLRSLAAFFEERSRTQRRLREALAYPSMILLLMLAVIGVLLIKVLPVFDQVYASLGSGLTGVAGGLLRLGQILKLGMPVLLALLILAVAGVVLYSRVPKIQAFCGTWAKKRFGDRGIFRKFNNARFARALAMGLASGLPLEEAAELAGLLLADIPEAASRCAACAEALKQGAELSTAMGSAALLSPSACRMLAVGLRGGSADLVMERIADQLMVEATDTLDGLAARVEPAMVLTASLLVGGILLTVMLPLMEILSSLG